MKQSYNPRDVLPQSLCVIRAANDLLFTEDGKQYVDLLGGSGTVLLGHSNPAIVSRVREQLDALWNTGAVPTRLEFEARAEVDRFFAPSHKLAGFYTTGMEAAEFALRVARQVTGKKGVASFEGSMHGKSMATARLGWPNDLVTLPDFHRVPYLQHFGEDAILEHLARELAKHPVSAVFIEPLLGSSGGYVPSRKFAKEVSSLCADYGSLLVVDEILTGFHRTGPAFLHEDLGLTPDIVLIGKAMGNGFPVSGVVVNRRYSITANMLPGSTYAGNPLAASAVVATLREMKRVDLAGMVANIEQTIVTHLSDLRESGIALRGKGALWILELPTSMSVPDVMADILRGGVIASPTANFIRLIPAATILPAHLSQACTIVREACLARFGTGR